MEKETTKTSEECKDRDVSTLPAEVYELTRKLKRELDAYPKIPDTEPFDKFLTDWGKESLTLDGIVQKYKETYAKLDSQYKDAARWSDDIDDWCKGTVGPEAKKKIDKLVEDYEAKEHELCCVFYSYRKAGADYLDCRGKRERATSDAKADFDLHKNFEGALKERLAGLKPLYDKAKKTFDDGNYNAVYGAGQEFQRALENLGVLRTWEWRAAQCESTTPAAPEGILKEWTPDELGKKLNAALRKLVLARYQQFGANLDWYNKELEEKKAKEEKEKKKADNEKDTENYKKACEDFAKGRSDAFVKEAGDVPPDETDYESSGSTSAQKSAPPAGGRPQQQTTPAPTNR